MARFVPRVVHACMRFRSDGDLENFQKIINALGHTMVWQETGSADSKGSYVAMLINTGDMPIPRMSKLLNCLESEDTDMSSPVVANLTEGVHIESIR